MVEGDELEDPALLLLLFLHYLQHQVRLLRLRDIHSVELLVVQVDAVLIEGLAHFAAQWLPVYSHAEIIDDCFDLLRQPGFEAQQVDIPH